VLSTTLTGQLVTAVTSHKSGVLPTVANSARAFEGDSNPELDTWAVKEKPTVGVICFKIDIQFVFLIEQLLV
jgi:hypothetical protein